jgi:hypothetical protein
MGFLLVVVVVLVLVLVLRFTTLPANAPGSAARPISDHYPAKFSALSTVLAKAPLEAP